jgi:predicted ester cyclase
VTGPDLGLQGLKDFLVVIRAAFPDAHAKVEDVVVMGDRVVVRHRHRGTQTGAFLGLPPSGKSIDFQGIEIARIADGKVAESWHVDDTLAMMQQIGAVPPLTPPEP